MFKQSSDTTSSLFRTVDGKAGSLDMKETIVNFRGDHDEEEIPKKKQKDSAATKKPVKKEDDEFVRQ